MQGEEQGQRGEFAGRLLSNHETRNFAKSKPTVVIFLMVFSPCNRWLSKSFHPGAADAV
jgi:hypothetical protein